MKLPFTRPNCSENSSPRFCNVNVGCDWSEAWVADTSKPVRGIITIGIITLIITMRLIQILQG